MNQEHWEITVNGWGTLFAIGTEADAEAWRSHKAQWEAGIATKRRVNPDEVTPTTGWDRLSELLRRSSDTYRCGLAARSEEVDGG